MNLPNEAPSGSNSPDLILETVKAGRGVLTGILMLFDSVRWLARRPRLLMLGMLPAFLAFVLVAGVLAILILRIRWLVDLLTPFADTWAPALQTATSFVVGIAVIAMVFALCVALFVSLSLAVGGPIYQRIWEAAEVSVHGYIPLAPEQPKKPGFWSRLLARRGESKSIQQSPEAASTTVCAAEQQPGLLFTEASTSYLKKTNTTVGATFSQGIRSGLRQAGSFLWRSSKNLIITTVLSLIPVVGGIAAIGFSQQLAIWALSSELSSRSLSAHGLSEASQAKILKLNRPTAYGFGLAAHLSFMIPLGAVLFMPAAIVGAAKLAHTCLEESSTASLPDDSP